MPPDGVRDRALLMISDSQIAELLIDVATLPLRAPLPSTLGPGRFAENIFVTGHATAKTLCVGDVLGVVGSSRKRRASGAAPSLRLQVCSPRQPCHKIDSLLGKRGDGHGVRAHAARTGSAGWFVRVLSCGELRDGDVLGVIERPHPQWTLERVASYLYGMDGVADSPSGYALPTSRAEARSKWKGTKAELDELSELAGMAGFEWRDEFAKVRAAWEESPRCAIM